MLSIIIPIHNRPEHSIDIVRQLSVWFESFDFDIILVNSGNFEEIDVMLKDNFFDSQFIHHIKVPENYFWCKSVKEGIYFCLNDLNSLFCLLLNDDLELSYNFIPNVFDRLKSSDDNTVIGGIVCDKKTQNILESSLIVNYDLLTISNSDLDYPLDLMRTDLIAGRCVIYPLNAFKERIQLRCDLFPHHYADFDLSRQAAKLGYGLFIDSNLVIHHKLRPSVELFSKNLVSRMLHIKSPDRFLSWYFFWKRYSDNSGILSILIKQIRKSLY
jgi:GT2 family glycosyltransferase